MKNKNKIIVHEQGLEDTNLSEEEIEALKDKIILIECKCPCHQPGVAMMHFTPCCENGYVRKVNY